LNQKNCLRVIITCLVQLVLWIALLLRLGIKEGNKKINSYNNCKDNHSNVILSKLKRIHLFSHRYCNCFNHQFKLRTQTNQHWQCLNDHFQYHRRDHRYCKVVWWMDNLQEIRRELQDGRDRGYLRNHLRDRWAMRILRSTYQWAQHHHRFGQRIDRWASYEGRINS